MIYTIQDGNGDRGWIQKIDVKGIEIDEISGCTIDSGKFDARFKHHYLVISEEEYKAIKCLHFLYDEYEDDHLYNAINLLIDATIEKNKENGLVGIK